MQLLCLYTQLLFSDRGPGYNCDSQLYRGYTSWYLEKFQKLATAAFEFSAVYSVHCM
jgi:hypothetical protein